MEKVKECEIEGVYMSPNLISDEILDQIRRHFDIVDIVGQYVPLKKSGRNFTGLCPFHSEKTPSFSVSPEKQIYHCFGCGAGGDVIGFVKEIEGLNYREAAIHLADEANILIPNLDRQTAVDPNEKQKNQFIHLYELTSKLYQYLLLETEYGKEALSYLSKRGFSREIIETYNIGYAPPGWDTLKNFLVKRDFSEEFIEQAGLIIKKDDQNYYDRFRNRIIFPIANTQGKVIAFGGRVLDDSLPKYLNSPETLIFNKSKTLYNLYLARKEIRKKRQAVLFEGYVDTISAYRAGVLNGVATLGTSLTEEQSRILKRYCDEIIISYDSDNAGKQATDRAVDILEEAGFRVKVLQLENGYDPDDYVKEYGPESFQKELFSSTMTSTAFKLEFIRRNYELKDESGKVRYLTEALKVIAKLQHAIEREHYLKNLSQEFNISYDSLRRDLTQISYENRKKKEKTRDNLTIKWNNIINNGNHVGRDKALLPAYYNAEKLLISLMLRDREIADKVEQEIGSEFHVEDFSVLAAYIYSYYGKGNEPDVNRLLTTIEDEKYVKLATQLLIMEINEDVTEEELNDYIFQVKKYNLDLEIKKKREEQLKAEKGKDFIKSAELGQEIINLRNQLKSWSK